MKKSTLSLTIVASSLIAGSAMADYTGLTSENVDNGDGTWTARIFANFDASTDELDAVFGDADNALFITSTNGFYQNAFGGATAADINPAASCSGLPANMTPSKPRSGLRLRVFLSSIVTIGTPAQ